MKIVPMTDAHVLAITPQAQQSADACDPQERLKVARELRAAGTAWAVIDGDDVLMLGGVQAQWQGRGMAWALLSNVAGRRLVRLTRAVRTYLDALDYRRLEMYVDCQFGEGCRWAELLGFTNETPAGMRGFLPGGNTAFMYGRTR